MRQRPISANGSCCFDVGGRWFQILGGLAACSLSYFLSRRRDLHAAELQAVGVGLVVGGQVVVVEDPNAEHGGVNAGTQEEDGDEARHLVERSQDTG